MFKRIPVEDGNIFAFQAIGKLTEEDYDRFLPELEESIRRHGRISLLVELVDFQGWEPRAAWEDFRFGLSHDRDFDRIAIVGDKRWEQVIIALANLVTRSRMRFFHRDEMQQAWDWLEHRDEQPVVKPVEPYRKLMLATDFSTFSRRAGERARELAERYQARLVVAHALLNPVIYTGEYDPLQIDLQIDQELEMEARERLNVFARELSLPEDADLELIWGSPKWALLSLAREKAVDAIVVGTHGHGGLDRLLGSVSSHILHKAECDVIVVK
jgi:universal stress protein A